MQTICHFAPPASHIVGPDQNGPSKAPLQERTAPLTGDEYSFHGVFLSWGNDSESWPDGNRRRLHKLEQTSVG
jgi:hypothetical protein